MKIIGYIMIFIVTAILAVLWNGYVLSVLWRWFIVPIFGAPMLSLGYAIGLATFFGYITQPYKSPKTEDKDWGDVLGEYVVVAVLKPAVVLLFGWVVTLFLS